MIEHLLRALGEFITKDHFLFICKVRTVYL